MIRTQQYLRSIQAGKAAGIQTRCLSTTPSLRAAEPATGPEPRIPVARDTDSTEGHSTGLPTEKKAGAVGGYHPENQPDYSEYVDHGTSLYSPVARRVQDGSEPGPTLSAAVLSGAPVDLQARTVRIYKQAKPATQSGSWGSHAWRMDWDPLAKGHRWENPLMGWQSSADAMQGTKINFKTKEDAIAFAEKQGYEFYVSVPQERRFVPKAYANNFLHEPGPLKHIKTK